MLALSEPRDTCTFLISPFFVFSSSTRNSSRSRVRMSSRTARSGILGRTDDMLLATRGIAESSRQLERRFELDRLRFADTFDSCNGFHGRGGKFLERAEFTRICCASWTADVPFIPVRRRMAINSASPSAAAPRSLTLARAVPFGHLPNEVGGHDRGWCVCA